MFPTERRNHPSVLLRYNGDLILFDCGEGTQKQLRKAKIPPTKIKYIFITHWHGDHSLGLPGMFQSLSAHGKKEKLIVVGPAKTKERIEYIKKAFTWYENFQIEVIEAKNGKVIETDEWIIKAMEVKHGTPCLAYSFEEKEKVKINIEYTKKFGLIQHPLLGKLQKGQTIEWKGKKITPKKGTFKKKGKKITYITDTVFFPELIDFSMDSDVIISECSFMDRDTEMALDKKHMITSQVGMLAKKSNAKKLLLFHISPRYSNEKEVVEEVKKVFEEAKLVNDLEKINV